MTQSSIFIVDENGSSSSLYQSWLGSLNHAVVIVTGYDEDWVPPPDCRLVISAQHYRIPEYGILRRCLERGVPTLIIADGILEYRNTWQHPDIAPGCIYQPVVGHKIACIGRSQARVLESWGNLGKCEIVGTPRFDSLLGFPPRRREEHEPLRLLIMTARTPGFTDDQRALTRRSLLDAKFWLAQNPRIEHRPIETVWRLTDGLDQEIGVSNTLGESSGLDLAETLHQVDAVLTTPSTAMLEAMLSERPTALLDYHGCPQYVPAAWTIAAPRHFDQMLPELFAPPAAKMLFQDTVLHDALECRSAATPRMIALIEEMLCVSGKCLLENRPLVFPDRLVHDEQLAHHLPEERFDMRQLHSGSMMFRDADQNLLQVELELSRREISRLRQYIRLNNFCRELTKSFPGPRKLLRLWREGRGNGADSKRLSSGLDRR